MPDLYGVSREWTDRSGRRRHQDERVIVTTHWQVWALLSALFAGGTAILAKVGVRDIDSDLATAIRTTVILIFAWGIAAFRGVVSFAGVNSRTWTFLALSGVATGFSWLCYFRALQMGDASRVAPLDKLSVVVAMVFGALLLGETLTWKHWLGGGFILLGALIIARA